MSAPTTDRVDVPASVMLALARLEARRLLRHPAPWLGLAASAWAAWTTSDDWSSALYQGYQVALTPLWLGISVAVAGVGARGLVPVAEAAPVQESTRAVARLVAGATLVALTLVTVLAAQVAVGVRGGIRLGDEPGRTGQAAWTWPEVAQPVLLAALAVTLSLALVRAVRHLAAAWLLLVLFWFLFGAAYWVFNAGPVAYVAPVQVQPFFVAAGPPGTDPATFPDSWLLAAPGEYQQSWARLVVSPAVAAAHDAYLLGLVVALAAAGLPRRRLLVGCGLGLAVVAVAAQVVLAP